MGNKRIGEVGNKSTGDCKYHVHSIIQPTEFITFFIRRPVERRKKRPNSGRYVAPNKIGHHLVLVFH